MEKVFTIEFDTKIERVQLHLNKKGAEFLRNFLSKLIENNTNSDYHFMSPDWGGDELGSDLQDIGDGIKVVHQLKILYSNE